MVVESSRWFVKCVASGRKEGEVKVRLSIARSKSADWESHVSEVNRGQR